jgi:hypothetical protein
MKIIAGHVLVSERLNRHMKLSLNNRPCSLGSKKWGYSWIKRLPLALFSSLGTFVVAFAASAGGGKMSD